MRRFLPLTPHRARLAAALALFLYLAVVRTWRISETFWLLGDQILYWRLAVAPWYELPLGGGPSSVGGTTLGPAFMWLMWAIRHVVGPFAGSLPHAGGVGISLLQSAADAFLFVAIWRRFASLPLALAVTLLAATAPIDMAITATIWNPPVAAALIKISIAFVLLDHVDAVTVARGNRSLGRCAGATAAALLALQCHSTAIFFAAPAIASFPLRELLARRVGRALRYAGAAAAVILVLETPFLIDRATHPGKQTSPARVVASVTDTIANPDRFRPGGAFQAVSDQNELILFQPWDVPWFGALLAACAAAVAFRARRDISLASVTIIPLLCAVAGFSLWQGAFDTYWFLGLAPIAALTLALGVTAWRPAAPAVALILAIGAVAAQPLRLATAMTMLRLPEYGPLARGSKEIRRRADAVRGIETTFALPPSTEPQFIYESLGGRISPAAPFAAIIDAGGRVTFVAAPEAGGRLE